MAVPTIIDVQNVINSYEIRLNKYIKNLVNSKFIMLERFKRSYILKNPMSIYEIKEQKLDNLIDNLKKDLVSITNNKVYKYNQVINSYVLKNPLSLTDKPNEKLKLLIKSLELLNPLGILEKGYSVTSINNEVINSIKKVKKDDELTIRLKDGNINAKVMEVNK